ncbi:MAG: hypothetical protein CM1200mP18_06920 [Gammaproteobacteria bacterium]|nr:MAG: hypothetical protein CM1200mP18_06920 [Gammaproteobacteria bacterium]
MATVAEHFGSVHLNNYGQVFDVRTGTNLTLGSNTGNISAHTLTKAIATPYLGSPVSLSGRFLGNGGETILVDGFKAAQKLKESDPASFEFCAAYLFSSSVEHCPKKICSPTGESSL